MLVTIPSLAVVTTLFKRPRHLPRDQYAQALLTGGDTNMNLARPSEGLPNAIDQLSSVFCAYYGRASSRLSQVVLIARDSSEFTDAIFALWSQQCPEFRRSFTFCTGSLSGRSIAGRAFDIQCSPPALAKDVAREAETEPFIETNLETDLDLAMLGPAIQDAILPYGGPFREFLWAVADSSSSRADFVAYVKVFDALNSAADAASFVDLIATGFPEPTAGRRLKTHLLSGQGGRLTRRFQQQDILLALSTTDKHSSFDAAALLGNVPLTDIFATQPQSTRRLVTELFQSSLNPLGDELLTRLVRAMEVEDAQAIVQEQPQLLPAFFRANPNLAASSQLWSVAGDRKRELMESLATEEIPSGVVPRIVSAMLDSGSDAFIRRAFERWGKDAVFAALDWTDNHLGSMSDASREALAGYLSDVMSWVESGERSTPALAAVVHVIAPYAARVATYDSTVWLRTAEALQKDSKEEAIYARAFLLALAFCNAPPAPLELIAESFEVIYMEAEQERLKDSAWMIVEPFVPKLSWRKNWDWCERMRRALLLAFVRYSWPAREINQRIKNGAIRQQILHRAHKVGAEYYFQNV
jgi:hypothetical protein